MIVDLHAMLGRSARNGPPMPPPDKELTPAEREVAAEELLAEWIANPRGPFAPNLGELVDGDELMAAVIRYPVGTQMHAEAHHAMCKALLRAADRVVAEWDGLSVEAWRQARGGK